MAQHENRTVTFLLSGSGAVPVGGFKVAYEYANGLAERGWNVRVVHPRVLSTDEIESLRSSFFLRTRRWIGYQRSLLTHDYRPDRWFQVSPKVQLLCTRTLEPQYLPPSDAWVKLYLIQHLETWCGPEQAVMATWKLPLRKIVISHWLEDVAKRLGEPSNYIPNGLDFKTFGMDARPEDRDPNTIAMLYHHSDWKGSADGLAAILKAKAKLPQLKVRLFGVPARPAGLPDWVEYHQNPRQEKLRAIYNWASIFISPSWAEGWPLPPAEALQCGAALAATDIGGHREYAIPGKTALLSPAKEPGALAANIVRLVEDHKTRIQLAQQGHQYIQQFTWDRALNSFQSVLCEALGAEGERRSDSDKADFQLTTA
jgi:glycosyltransferase involved in cell wall biosynthesis